MDYVEQIACMAPVAPVRSAAGRFAAECERLDAELAVAAEALERDPDAAAIALDGVPQRLLCAWYEAHGFPPLLAGDVLVDLDRRAPDLAWRLRRALRAPNAAVRLARARQVLSAFAQSVDGVAGASQAGKPSAASGAAERSGWRLVPGERPGA